MFELPSQVHEHEEKVTELLGSLGIVLRLEQLDRLLLELLDDALDIRPVVAERRCARLHLLRVGQGRKRPASPGTPRAAMSADAGPFLGSVPAARSVSLDLFPVAEHLADGRGLRVAEHVRVAAHDLRRDGPVHVAQVEDARFRGVLRVQDNLEEEIAKLAGQLRRGPALKGVVDLVRLLQEERTERQVGLLAVPRAAIGRAQAGHDPREAVRARHVRLGVERGQDVGTGRKGRVVDVADGRVGGSVEPQDRVRTG